ncbi:hypothetical protein BpHYR1_006552 [Brachionus plicatilis]|uniref:Uncharacterized protein n=1 Tax=Brachionus plicatilis TaxID=10195 RepID=A0A3M7SZJ0_BRAPC|nr:hypothetical protein BpHYR1_006552 [Brachionus plicatilis]
MSTIVPVRKTGSKIKIVHVNADFYKLVKFTVVPIFLKTFESGALSNIYRITIMPSRGLTSYDSIKKYKISWKCSKGSSIIVGS